MGENRWLPANYELTDGSRIRNLYVSGKNWQLYVTSAQGQALAVDRSLHQAWLDGEWLEEGIFQEENGYYLWHAHQGSLISSVEYGPYPTLPMQAESFVRALKRSREQFGMPSFADALYISQFPVLLPTFSDGAPAEDALVLGRWLTGGINVPVTDTLRMRRYAPWLTARALDRLLESMGLTADAGATGILDAPQADSAQAVPASSPRKDRASGEFSLPGRPELERFFREEVLDMLDREDEYRRMGIGFPGPVLLYGPPGCGKTFAVKKLTEYLGWPVFEITSGTVGSKYIHETSRRISEMFDSAIANAPSVIVIDELEAFLSAREAAHASREAHLEEVAEFLRRISDVGQHRVLLFGMTNMLDAIDKALLRRGRFDHVLEVGMPSEEEILSLLKKLLEPLPTDKDLPLGEFAGKLKGYPISDVAFVVREAGRIAVRARCAQIGAGHLKTACERVSVGKPPVRRIGF